VRRRLIVSVIYRVWVDVEVYDPETEETETIEVDFGPSFTIRPHDETSASALAARLAAVTYAERLHEGRPVDEDDETDTLVSIVEVHDETEVAS
jgi:hypothetical protein